MQEMSPFSQQAACHSGAAFSSSPAAPSEACGNQGCRIASRSSAPQLRQQRLGSIINGVLQAAKCCDNQGVYRIEEMHQQARHLMSTLHACRK